MERGERARPLPTTFLKGPKLGSLGVFVFGIPGFSLARSGGLQGCQCCQGSGCALRNTNLLTHRAGDCDRQRSATSRKCFQVENSVFFLHHFHFECGAHFFFFYFLCFLFYFFVFSMLTRKVGKSTLVFLLFYVFILLLFSYSVFLLHSKRLVCLFLLRCFVLFCSLYLPPAVFPHFLYYHAIYHFLCQTLAHSHTQLAVLLPLAPCLFFATFPQCFVEGRGKVGGIYSIY